MTHYTSCSYRAYGASNHCFKDQLALDGWCGKYFVGHFHFPIFFLVDLAAKVNFYFFQIHHDAVLNPWPGRVSRSVVRCASLWLLRLLVVKCASHWLPRLPVVKCASHWLPRLPVVKCASHWLPRLPLVNCAIHWLPRLPLIKCG